MSRVRAGILLSLLLIGLAGLSLPHVHADQSARPCPLCSLHRAFAGILLVGAVTVCVGLVPVMYVRPASRQHVTAVFPAAVGQRAPPAA